MWFPERNEPGPGQESVWDYPRPPRLERSNRHVRVSASGVLLADSRRALRVCETASPPVYYVPAADTVMDRLAAARATSVCEWKGQARYFDVVVEGELIPRAAWSYPAPAPRYAALRDYIAFYPGKVECFLDGEPVAPQPGEFYGGWVTADVVGPFKGAPGTLYW